MSEQVTAIPQSNPENLREIDRHIASVVVISSDRKILLGQKPPKHGGAYNDDDYWHIPGGGIEAEDRVFLPDGTPDESPKQLDSGETVWCKMTFNRFEAQLTETAAELETHVRPGPEFARIGWFGDEELAGLKQIPGGREFFVEMGYIPTAKQ